MLGARTFWPATQAKDRRIDYLNLTKYDDILRVFQSVYIQTISIAPLQVHYYSEALPTRHGYCVRVSRRSATGNCE